MRLQDAILRDAEHEPSTGARRAKVRTLWAHRVGRVGCKIELRGAQLGQNRFLIRGKYAARAAPPVVVVREVAKRNSRSSLCSRDRHCDWATSAKECEMNRQLSIKRCLRPLPAWAGAILVKLNHPSPLRVPTRAVP
jgi:hypothetical protein